MTHNEFKFTIRCLATDDIPARDIIADYIKTVVESMPTQCLTTKELLITFYKDTTYIAYLTLIAHDYGVAVVGIDIVSEWIGQLFQNLGVDGENFGFDIEMAVIHPRNSGSGAIVTWDYNKNEPVIKILTIDGKINDF